MAADSMVAGITYHSCLFHVISAPLMFNFRSTSGPEKVMPVCIGDL